MNQGFSAQALNRKTHHKYMQASGAKKITVQNATYLQHILVRVDVSKNYLTPPSYSHRMNQTNNRLFLL
jgi:hypothetical protein